MSREIEFRAKCVDGGGWVYGYYRETQGYDCETLHLIHSIEDACTDYLVDPKTLGQYTGLKDWNGKKIYEGDIVRYNKTQYEVSKFFGSYMLQRVDDEVIDYSDFPLSIFSCGSNEMKFVGSKNDYCVSFYELADNQQDFEGCLYCEVIGTIYNNPEILEV